MTLILPFGLTACSSGVDANSSTNSSSTSTTHLVVTNWRNGDDGMLALHSGVLVKLPDGCVGMRDAAQSKPVLLRWRAGTALSADGTAVVGSSGERFDFDSEIGMGGGFGGAPVPSECESSLWAGVYEIQQPL
ncbi:hypothetical protein IV498_13710 [Paenarthrobacter sp. Z7-10]|uniref:hypothetical protein n=1 Tax=Paenarthrobacter sp. Z7-10 TaxID=2787635 RepID=UPI0022A9A780|nr:hypothetical protein [Paenarthrobacter sp. Z7-10]MCZ2404206.1 hypothetical protein [Paenarthrobacter sp. Z7-10]